MDRSGLQEGRGSRSPRGPRLDRRPTAEKHRRRRAAAQPGKVTEESKPTTSASPLLYDLTSLQREANGRFGFSAKTTLSLAQALYEKHKVLTYPRTDSRALPEDYLPVVKDTLKMLATEDLPGPLRELGPHACEVPEGRLCEADQARLRQRQGADHFAIIPTLQAPKSLSDIEAKLYDLVVKRFIAVFYPSAEYQVTTRLTQVEEHRFQTNGKVLVNPGWLAVYGKEAQDDDAMLVPVQKDEVVRNEVGGGRRHRRRAHRRATTKARCCRRWRARAS